ncbi:MAG: hypothetical protein FD137_1124, partial [Spirochaetes bacterium]
MAVIRKSRIVARNKNDPMDQGAPMSEEETQPQELSMRGNPMDDASFPGSAGPKKI